MPRRMGKARACCRGTQPGRFSQPPDAGRQLAARLLPLAGERPAGPRPAPGGVPVAEEVAALLAPRSRSSPCASSAPPHNPEYGIGAIAEGGTKVFDQEALAPLGIDGGALERHRRARERRAAAPGRGLSRRPPAALPAGPHRDRRRRRRCNRRHRHRRPARGPPPPATAAGSRRSRLPAGLRCAPAGGGRRGRLPGRAGAAARSGPVVRGLRPGLRRRGGRRAGRADGRAAS